MDHNRIVALEERKIAFQECAFDIWFTKKYAGPIAALECLEEDFAMSWLTFGAKHFSGMEWTKGDAFIFLPPGTQRLARRSKNRHRNRRREAR